MKRAKFLWPLTQGHQVALMASKNIRERLAANPSDPALADEVEAFFALDLEPHFKAEEALLDFLETRWGGQDPDLVRTRKDHAALRRSAASGRAEEMVRFGEELKAHIQYEEGVLFDRFESSLTPEEAKTWGERFVGVTPSQPSNPLALKR